MGIPKHPKTTSILQAKLFDGLTSFKELEARIASLPTEKERGDAFEVFAEAFLATQAIVGAQKVWPFDALPQGIKKRLGLKGKDQGVDGVFETNTGESVAYQVKYRSARKPITWDEISTFVGLAEKAHNRLVLTNSYIIRDPLVERERLYCYRGYDLDQLEARDLQAIRDYLTETPQPIPQKELRPHQVEAQRRILEALKQADRTILEMACGTGKTLTALRIAESFGAKTLLCLFPSLALIRQTLQEWCKETKWEPGKWIFLCVCSDPTIQTYDDVVLVNSDLNFPVSTESQMVREFLTLPFDGVRVVFSTYQSSPVVAKGMTKPFELAIFDEAHRTAGREGTNFSFALSDNNLPIKKRLFMTATPRHCRIKEDLEESTVFSMDKPEVYGQVDYRYPFSKAVAEGQICDYRIVISCIGREDLRRHDLEHGETLVGNEVYRSRFAASLLTLSKVIDGNKLKKVIAFTSRVEDARKVAEKIPSFLPDVEPFFVSGDMQTAQREEEMQAFRECEKGVISNARCLTEGVDVPAVDAVAFLTPKKSKIDIVQAVGRAMRTSPGKRYGFVVLPVHLEVGETEEEAVKKTNFDMVWDVVRFLLEQDSQAEEIFQKIRIEQGTGRPIDFSRLREKVQVVGVNIALEDLERAIYLRLLERTVSNWWEMYGKLRTFKEKYGDCLVMDRWEKDQQLANWVHLQRSMKKKGVLSLYRIRLLDELGFVWDMNMHMWMRGLVKLKEYKSKHGDCNVPMTHNDKYLVNWLVNQRVAKRKNKLSHEKDKVLDEMGVQWDFRSSPEDLKAISEQYLKDTGEEFSLSKLSRKASVWLTTARKKYLLGKASSEEKEFIERYSLMKPLKERKRINTVLKMNVEAEKILKEFGTLRGVLGLNKMLFKFIERLRKKANKGEKALIPDEMKFYERFCENRLRSFEERIKEAREYLRREGSFIGISKKNTDLARWLTNRRMLLLKKKSAVGMSPEQHEQAIRNLFDEFELNFSEWVNKGIDYAGMKSHFNIKVKELKDYLDSYNSLKGLTYRNKPLLYFLYDQRKHFRKGKLPEREKIIMDIFESYGINYKEWLN